MSKIQNFFGVAPKSSNEMYTRVKIKYLRYLLKVSLRVIHFFIYIYFVFIILDKTGIIKKKNVAQKFGSRQRSQYGCGE